jgi:hypothetical protein
MTDEIPNTPRDLPARRVRWGAYCLLVVLLPLLYLAAAVLIVPSEWAARHTRNTYQANMGYADRLHGANCGIVIYGDSTALVGIDPSVLEAKTGLTACNIAEFEGATTVFGTGLVDDFLAHNRRPRFLIFAYTADSLTPQSGWTGPSKVEAIVYAMRTRRNLRTVSLLLRHPQDTFGVLESGLRYLIRDSRKPPLTKAQRTLRDNKQGWFPLPQGIASRCTGPPENPGPFDPEWIASLRRKYGVDGTHVLVFVSPDPACEPTYATYVEKVRGVTDNQLEIFPLSEFSDNGRLHLTGDGVTHFSTEIAGYINATLHAEAGR